MSERPCTARDRVYLIGDSVGFLIRYSLAGIAYDPVSLFLLDLFRHLEKYAAMEAFVETLRD